MSKAACKAIICENMAIGLLNSMCQILENFKEESPKVRIKISEKIIKDTEQMLKDTSDIINNLDNRE